jgi:hypothetical protein
MHSGSLAGEFDDIDLQSGTSVRNLIPVVTLDEESSLVASVADFELTADRPPGRRMDRNPSVATASALFAAPPPPEM